MSGESMSDAMREFLAEIVTALDVPLAADDTGDRAHQRILADRVSSVSISIQGLLQDGDPVFDTRWLRKRITETPITYEPYVRRDETAMTDAEASEQLTRGDLVDTVICPTCNVAVGVRCITRASKPAREPHGRRYSALEQAAGITQHRATARREAQARGYTSNGLDHKAEASLLTAYAARRRSAQTTASGTTAR
ncbi:hypothetical protein ACIBJC_15180 [Streptomyces sp. NPDC050509]|uniref:zinc finger domain-containing protein n=1 Tax=Streptomyces sp. NPDC050509 TaxID=3365620 RepID=UPI00379DBD85